MAEKIMEVVEISQINPKETIITIVGDGDLICNKMNDVATRQLIDARKDKAKKVTEKPNMWEEVITSVHWRDGKPTTDPSTWTEDTMKELLIKNAPCLSAFGFGKCMSQAVTRFGIDTFSTKFNAAVNVISNGGLIPIKFSGWYLDEKLMSPKKGSPILARQNIFSDWSAEIHIRYIDNLYSLEQIVDIINLAGFGLGMGSGRNSGFGRFHVTNVEIV